MTTRSHDRDSWYPTRQRAAELDQQLAANGPSFLDSRSGEEVLSALSRALSVVAREPSIPNHHLRSWIWIGSQFRIEETRRPEVAQFAAGAIQFLVGWAESGGLLSESFLQEFRWVTASTEKELQVMLGANSFRRFLSEEEIRKVESLFCDLYPSENEIDIDDLASRLEAYTQELSDISSATFFPEVGGDIDFLRNIATAGGENASWAVAALRYVTLRSDVIPDDLGYLGLVDDLHVIKEACVLVGREPTWRPLLEKLLRSWPHIERMTYLEGDHQAKASWHLQIVCAAFLEGASSGDRIAIVLEESGPAGALAALAAVTSSMTEQGRRQVQVVERFAPGAHVVLVDGAHRVRLIYRGRDEREGARRYKVEFLRGTTCSLLEENAALLRAAPKRHNTLSSINAYHKWRANYRPHGLRHIVGYDLNLDDVSAQVLLVTSSGRLNEYAASIKPFGQSISELVGVRYFTSGGNYRDLPGTSARPLLYACSDVSTAVDLLSGRLYSPFEPSYVLVDKDLAPGDAEALRDVSLGVTGLVFLSGQHEIEAGHELAELGYKQVLIRGADIDPCSRYSQAGPQRGSLYAYAQRQSVAAIAEFAIHEIPDPRIEALHKSVSILRQRLRESDDDTIFAAAILAADLLRYVCAVATRPSKAELDAIGRRARRLRSECAVHSDYEPSIVVLAEIAKFFADDRSFYHSAREAKIVELVESIRGSRVGVLCRSRRAAASARGSSALQPALRHIEWLTFEDIQDDPPWDRIIVCGWLQTMTMRRIRHAGYARHVDLVLYKFERDMEEVGRRAAERRRHSLERTTEAFWRRSVKAHGINAPPPVRQVSGNRQPDQVSRSGDSEDSSEWIDDHVKLKMRQLVQRQSVGVPRKQLVRARLVAFSEPGLFIQLATHGRVVSVSALLESDLRILGDEAENHLMIAVRRIVPGMLLAFSIDHPQDLLDVVADTFLSDPIEQRRLSGLWRTALRDYCQANGRSVNELKCRLEAAGLARSAQTVRHWLHVDDVIAPQRPVADVAIIRDLTGHPELSGKHEECIRAINDIYKARRHAARRLVEELGDRELDVEDGVVSIAIEDRPVHYRVLRVARVGDDISVPRADIGVLKSVMAYSDGAPRRASDGADD